MTPNSRGPAPAPPARRQRLPLEAYQSTQLLDGAAGNAGDEAIEEEVISDRHRDAGDQCTCHDLAPVEDVAALGLPITQGVVLTEAWYWDMNDNNRAWTKRWQAERPGKVPTSAQAGVYSAVTHYLKTVEALKSDADGRAVAAKMKEIPTDDRLYGKGTIRADGRKIHDMYLFEVKTPSESRYFGDFYKLRATIPAAEAFRPLKDGGCSLVNG
jgi:branched-chain amino acid transport system substrate-binding protein